ncbi:MAG: aldo/keto reductase [Chthonomonadales bacterium]|nr:aldo/keto reductase [Chthonomonadales bacterium]
MVERRRLGRNGPELTTVGFGAWAVGGPWRFGWGRQDDRESVAAIRKAVDLGVNWIDTAAVYGVGHSEEVVGEALGQLGATDAYVATKCGRAVGADGTPHGDLRPASIRAEMDASLRRLGLDHVDLYQIHWPETETGTPLEESWQAMADLQDEGKARWIGVSNFDVAQLERCEAIRHVDSLQPPLSLLRREAADELIPWCLRNGTGVIVYSPMQAGLLSGSFRIGRVAEDDWRRRNPLFQGAALAANLAFVERLRPIAERHGRTVGNLAVAWALGVPGVTSAIVGARRPAQVEENVGAMGLALSPDDLAEIGRAYAETAAERS